jgi:hypothetical protein
MIATTPATSIASRVAEAGVVFIVVSYPTSLWVSYRATPVGKASLACVAAAGS